MRKRRPSSYSFLKGILKKGGKFLKKVHSHTHTERRSCDAHTPHSPPHNTKHNTK
jgi:hypothetical protein